MKHRFALPPRYPDTPANRSYSPLGSSCSDPALRRGRRSPVPWPASPPTSSISVSIMILLVTQAFHNIDLIYLNISKKYLNKRRSGPSKRGPSSQCLGRQPLGLGSCLERFS